MSDRVAMYVRTLFELLAFLGVQQREVASHFGVSAGMVSHWAHGNHPMPQHRGDAFLAFVQEQQDRAIERAKAEPRPAARASTVLTGGAPHTPEEVLQDQISRYWARWDDEIQETSGAIYEDMVGPLQILGRYAQLDKDKLREVLNATPGARQARATLTTAGKALLRELSRLERANPVEEGR